MRTLIIEIRSEDGKLIGQVEVPITPEKALEYIRMTQAAGPNSYKINFLRSE